MRWPRPTASSASLAVRLGSAERALRHVERQQHVLVRGHGREQVVGLEHEADVAAADRGQLLGVEPVRGVASDLQLARGRRQDAAEDRQQRGLAAARRAHEQRQLARIQRHLDALQHLEPGFALAEKLGDAFGREDRLAGGGLDGGDGHGSVPWSACLMGRLCRNAPSLAVPRGTGPKKFPPPVAGGFARMRRAGGSLRDVGIRSATKK